DPFGEQLKKMMEQIQRHLEMPDLPQDFGTQTYEQRVVELEKNRTSLQALAGDRRYENPRLGKLEEILREHFQPLGASRGIVFTKTRQSAHSYSNQTRHMTQNEQQDVIKRFREGTLNLLFSTSVAEEGLDIPECNIVVRYGLMTNEIAMMQAQGRARAKNSVYSILAKASSRELSRELLNENLVELMERAIRAVQAMPEQEYTLKIRELQRVAVASWLMKEARISERQQLHDPDEWGMEMIYRHVKLPILSIKNFVVETPAEKRTYKKWSAVTFPIKEFDYLEYCSSTHGQSL
ncbi:PREDICTED: probable ATP-dependent RNA helicase DHX58, partial [Apaloderma vittatum]|uniref:probable ATP-dependent RNA helicase DHX58 n=1 Tax=Apaloderma vittatum TaxID=57397 RepID=UPI0005218712